MRNRRRDDAVDALGHIPSRVETLRDYSQLTALRVRVYRPRHQDDLREILAHANAARRRVTFRAGGHSFDTQSLGTGLVVSMQSFGEIEVRPEERQVHVGSGATWGAILAELEPHGLVPAVTVTTEHATAGGTLSGDCLSRFSPAYGKEGEHVVRFVMMTPAGDVITCTPPRDGVPPDQRTLEERLFLGVIGGLGYLGPVLSITYRVLRVGPTSSIRVKTMVRRQWSFRDLADDLVPTACSMRQRADPTDETQDDAIYSALYRKRGGAAQVLVLRSAFTTSATGKSMLLYRPKALVRVPVEWLIRWTTFNAWLWWFAWRFGYRDPERTFVDRLAGFTFFMDGNTRAKHVAARFGIHLKTLQQTFVVPADLDDLPATQERLTRWLEHAAAEFDSRRLTPTFHDLLYLPRDMPFALSATADTAGFAVSYAFETGRRRKLSAVESAFEKLSDDLWNQCKGRVYLVKDVRASKPTLAAMYGQNAVDFFALKDEVDPNDILRNEFLDRTISPPFRASADYPARHAARRRPAG